MAIIEKLLRDVPMPPMVRVRQRFSDDSLPDAAATLREQLRAPRIAQRVRPGARIAVAVGSRGLAELPRLVRVLVDELRLRGAEPFIVPAMGSHGGATAEGQTAVLAALGVTEASAGCRILSSMETVELGTLSNGLPILMDRHAMDADGIVVLNRVKPHTSFSGPSESGLVKMITIGLGNQRGADSCHALGFGEMARNIVDMARLKIAQTPILFGVATVENAYERIVQLEVVPAEEIIERDVELLQDAKRRMPRILFDPLDVLVVDRMGKEYSGTGTDPNITGRAATPFVEIRQRVARLVVLDLTEKTRGNATGVGLADVCTRRLFDRIDFEATYANHITSTVLAHAKIPVMMESDRLAVQAAVKTCNVSDALRVRLVRVPNTLYLEHIRISESLLDEALAHPDITVVGAAEPWAFDADGNLSDLEHGTQ